MRHTPQSDLIAISSCGRAPLGSYDDSPPTAFSYFLPPIFCLAASHPIPTATDPSRYDAMCGILALISGNVECNDAAIDLHEALLRAATSWPGRTVHACWLV